MALNQENLPELIDNAKRAIEVAGSFEEIKAIRDQAEMMRQYAKRIDAGLEAQNRCAEIKIRAERRMGQELQKMEKAKPGPIDRSHNGTELAPRLQDIGINKNQSARWQQIASLDDEEFESAVRDQEEVTTRGVLRVAEQKRRQDRDATLADFAPPMGQYSIIVADPPWRYEMRGANVGNRSIEKHYPTMSLEEICTLPIPAGDNALLYLWATAPKLAEAFQVMEAWQFDYRTCAVWVKDKIGLGYHFRNKHELLLVGRRGNMPAPEPGTQLDSVVAERTEHSRKPDVFYDMVAACYPNLPRLEMFARGPRDGWDVWGNEA